MNLQEILSKVYTQTSAYIGQGKVADYIPELATIPSTKFGIALQTIDGKRHVMGDASEKFSIQSISKVISLTLAMTLVGDEIWKRVGREPSGNPFNSLVQLEYEAGIPRNPFINAGAIVVTDILLSHLGDVKQVVLDFARHLADNQQIDFDTAVAQSEMKTGYRNSALANFLKSFNNLENDPDVVLDVYYHLCALSMSCKDVAQIGLFLANGGVLPRNEERITTLSQAKYILSLMLTCGTYDSVGDFAYRVGLPGKSGVGGGILAVLPKKYTICVWSPGLNQAGNSLVGTKALELFTTLTEDSIF